MKGARARAIDHCDGYTRSCAVANGGRWCVRRSTGRQEGKALHLVIVRSIRDRGPRWPIGRCIRRLVFCRLWCRTGFRCVHCGSDAREFFWCENGAVRIAINLKDATLIFPWKKGPCVNGGPFLGNCDR